MNPWWKVDLSALAFSASVLIGWHAHGIWDEAQLAKTQREQIADHAAAEEAMNAEAADYEQQKQALEKQIYDLKQNLSRARRGPGAAPCRVPPDVVQSVDAAASHGLSR